MLEVMQSVCKWCTIRIGFGIAAILLGAVMAIVWPATMIPGLSIGAVGLLVLFWGLWLKRKGNCEAKPITKDQGDFWHSCNDVDLEAKGGQVYSCVQVSRSLAKVSSYVTDRVRPDILARAWASCDWPGLAEAVGAVYVLKDSANGRTLLGASAYLSNEDRPVVWIKVGSSKGELTLPQETTELRKIFASTRAFAHTTLSEGTYVPVCKPKYVKGEWVD